MRQLSCPIEEKRIAEWRKANKDTWPKFTIKMQDKKPTITKPPHYNSSKISALNVIDDWKLPFRPANAIKYIQRYPMKGTPVEDLRKAVEYLQLEIKRLQDEQGTAS